MMITPVNTSSCKAFVCLFFNVDRIFSNEIWLFSFAPVVEIMLYMLADDKHWTLLSF